MAISMGLEKQTCAKCCKGFEDGHVLAKNDNKLYHHLAEGLGVPPIRAILSCSLLALDGNQKIGVYYKDKFYDLEKNGDKLVGIDVSFKSMYDDANSINGHKILGDLSFLDNLEPDP